MSGYLHRLTSSVMRPAETVHPMVGSVFSPATEPTERESAALVAESLPVPSRRRDTPDQEQEDRAELGKSETLIFHEETKRQGSGERHPKEVTTARGLQASEQQQKSETRQRNGQSEDSSLAARENSKERSYVPLLPVAAPRPDSRVPISESPRALAPVPRAAEKRGKAQHKQQEPDEIQIHIGRIEVLAMQQAPAAPVVKPARKASSLDEYLRRRDGRTL